MLSVSLVRCFFMALLAICVLPASAGDKQIGGPFQGDWSIHWCPPVRADGDCGGLFVALYQQGATLCGTYSGATPALEQVDDGESDAILGQVVGRVAVLAVRGGRSGEVRLVRAQLKGSKLQWRVLQTVSPPLHDASHDDTMIVGIDELLSKGVAGAIAPNDQCMKRFVMSR